MKIERDKIRTCYLQDTAIENIFINEYMPDAPCDFVKVYLLAQMYAGMNEEVSAREIAKTLMIPDQEVEKAFEYWCKSGIMRKTAEGVKFLSMREQYFGSHNEDVITPDSSRRLMNDEKIQAMFNDIEQTTKEFLQPPQMQTILGWMEDYDASCELISEAYRYCAGIGKINTRYVGSVVRNWVERGLATKEEIDEYLSEMDQRYAVYKRVMKALGFYRNPTENERVMISAWIDELGCTMDQILDACSKTSGISNPNINYVDSVLRNKAPKGSAKEAGRPSRNLIMDYYEKLRNESAKRAARCREEVYERVPEIRRIDEEIRECNMELTRTILGGSRSENKALQEKLASLERDKERLLTEHNIPVDYMKERPHCRICGDTGITKEGNRCSCYEEAARAVAAAN